MIKIFKKLSFLWIVIVALAIHFVVKGMNLEPKDEVGKLAILWLAFLAIMFNMIMYRFNKKYKDGWDDFNNSEFDIDFLTGKKTSKRIDIENNGIFTSGLVERVSNNVFRSVVIRVIYCMITYSFFDKSGKKIIKTKKYNDQGLQNIPIVGDKIKILYAKSNSNDSVIFHEEVISEIKWYKLKQKKFTITIINKI